MTAYLDRTMTSAAHSSRSVGRHRLRYDRGVLSADATITGAQTGDGGNWNSHTREARTRGNDPGIG